MVLALAKLKKTFKLTCTKCWNSLLHMKTRGHSWIPWKRSMLRTITLSSGDPWICTKWKNVWIMDITQTSPCSKPISNSSWTIADCTMDKIMVTLKAITISFLHMFTVICWFCLYITSSKYHILMFWYCY